MTEPPKPEDGSSIPIVESLPDGSLSFDQVNALEEADAIELAAPIVIEEHSGRITHFNLVSGDTHYYVGWNQDKGQWERILVVTEEEESLVVEQVTTFFDDESGDPEIWFDTEADPGLEALADFIWEYVQHTYQDTSGLRNIIGEATEDFLNE